MNDMNLIHGRNICAMVNDNTSVKEMLQMMGVDPTDEMVNDAINYFALNGDILVYNKVLDCSFELSSMGIRVDKEALMKQLKQENALDRINLAYHKMVLDETLPFTIGGGIGQSRMCMLFLNKKHIGEVQASYWPESIRKECEKEGIMLL